MVSTAKSVDFFTSQGLHNGVYRASDDCLATVCGEACVNSHFVPRWRSLSLSAQNFNHAAILTKSEHMNTAVNEKVVSISENDLSTSDTRFSSKYSHNNSVITGMRKLFLYWKNGDFVKISYLACGMPMDGKIPEILLIASEHQKRTPKNSHDCISLTEQSSNLLLSSVHSNKSFNDSVSWDIPLTYMMLNTDHNPGCDFNQTQIKREEYVKDKANVEQNIKVELSKDDLKKNCFVTQHTIIYPVSHLEMQCFPNNTYEFKYEDAKDRKDGDTQTAILHRDQYSQTKELIVTQSAELSVLCFFPFQDMNRAVSVLNIMLQRRLNNVSIQHHPKTNELNDFVDKSDAPLSNSKHLSIEPEIKKKTAVVAKQQYGYIESKENLLRRYCHENSCEKTSQKSGSDGRSTIRDRLPRGQTRKLASLFETMSDAANVEMLQEIDHLKRRGKSVPPNIINKTCHREPEVNIRERFRDLTIPCKRNGFEEQFVRDKRIVQSSVRSIVNRFESVSAPNKYQSPPRTLQVDITPQKPIHQKQYSQYVKSMLKPIVLSITKVFEMLTYALQSNYGVCIITRSSSPRSDEWNEYVSRGNPSYNLPHDITSCANVWDQQQYELGLHKGITSLKRYDSSYSRLPNEFLSRDPSYTLQTHIRQMNYSPEIQSNYHMAVITDEKHSYEKKLDSEIVDHVAEVEKAFDFVNKTESLATPGQQCSQESLGKSSHAKASYFISLYHDLEREYRKSPNGDIPARFSPIVYSPLPSIGEQLTTYEHKNPIMKSAKLGTHMITTDPMATSTPLDDSPAANSRMHTSASYMSNRSGISSITASTAQEIIQLQQSDIGLQTIKQEIMIQEGQIAQASLALTHCKKNNSFNGTLVEASSSFYV
uniref:Ras-GEF domain-containing protein n=1 Tax=Onchocerca flexuosa TaxID=387005 RepID=A0A183HXZ4_9BILA